MWILGFVAVAEGVSLGAAMVFRRIPAGRAILLWLAMYTIGYALLHVPNFPWYYAPPALFSAVVFWAGIHHLSSRLARNLVVGSALTVGLAIVLALGATQLWDASNPPLTPHREAGLWLHEHAHPGQTVVAYEIGMLGYLSDLNTIDLLGLTEPEALPYLQRGDYAWAIRAEPDFVFTPEQTDWPVIAAIYAEPTFAANYEVVARFHNKPGFDYLLYQRVTRPPA